MLFEGIPLTTIGYAFIGGVLPTMIWLWFWMKEDSGGREPKTLIALTFIGGMVSVLFALSLEKVLSLYTETTTGLLIGAAAIEEVLKFLVVALIAFRHTFLTRPTDYIMYMITGALGFAALENTLFLVEPLTHHGLAITVLTGNLRFLGATVLHTVASAAVGVSLGVALYHLGTRKYLHMSIGLLTAILLHIAFNYFIMKGTFIHTIAVFGILWIVAVVAVLAFEKLKRLQTHIIHS